MTVSRIEGWWHEFRSPWHGSGLSVYREGSETMVSLYPASRLAAAWMSQLQELREFLDREPFNPNAWRWRIRSRILAYLVSRYASDPKVGNSPSPQASPDVTAPFIISQPVKTKALLPGPLIRKLLMRVAQENKSKIGLDKIR